jgi:hypothetical protein
MAIDPANWQRAQRRRVQMRRLDTLKAQSVVTHADFIKIDCEGFEPAVLKGAQAFLATGGTMALEIEIGFNAIHWPQTHFLAVYEQLLPHGFMLSNLAFDRIPCASSRKRVRELGVETPHTVSRPGTYNMLFLRTPRDKDSVLKAAIILELYGMADSAFDLLDAHAASFSPDIGLRHGMDLLIVPASAGRVTLRSSDYRRRNSRCVA